MESTSKITEVLNDLIEINNDRVAGFEKSIADLENNNPELKVLFQEYASQSRKNTQELSAIVGAHAGDVETGNSISGTIHRAWIDVKAVFGGNDAASILSEAERGEDAIKKAYKTALTEGELSGEASTTVARQAEEQIHAHDKIKALRDAAKLV
jgi:uncharacterized protein (TIGR02284 family)